MSDGKSEHDIEQRIGKSLW